MFIDGPGLHPRRVQTQIGYLISPLSGSPFRPKQCFLQGQDPRGSHSLPTSGWRPTDRYKAFVYSNNLFQLKKETVTHETYSDLHSGSFVLRVRPRKRKRDVQNVWPSGGNGVDR